MDEVEKAKRKKFRKMIRGTVECSTIKQMLDKLENETGLNKSDVARWMECDPSVISRLVKSDSVVGKNDHKYRRRIRSVCRDLTLRWKFQERPLFGFDDDGQ